MGFCGDSDFWNATLLLENWWPQFTQCFQDTAVTFVPCGWLFVTALVHIAYLRSHKMCFHLPTTWLSISRLLCSFVLALLAVLQAIERCQDNAESASISHYVSKSVWAFSYLYVIFIMILSQRGGVSSPCIVFIFWTLALIAHIIPTYTAVILKMYDDDILKVFLTFLTMFVLVIEFILQCVGDFKVVLLPQATPQYRPCLSNKASFLSKATFSWVFSIIYTGYKETVKKEDLTDLPPHMQCRNLMPGFMSSWKKELKITALRNRVSALVQNPFSSYTPGNTMETDIVANEKTKLLHNQKRKYSEDCHVTIAQPCVATQGGKRSKPSLYKVLLKVFYPRLFKAQIVGLVGDVLQFVNPLLLGQMIHYTDNKDEYRLWQGFILAGSFFLVVFVSSIAVNFRFYNAYNIGAQVKTALTAAIYKKSLTMNAESRRQFTIGTIVNLMAVDCPRFQDLTTVLWTLVSWPVQTSLAFYMLYQQVGLAFLAGIGVLAIIIPINGRISTLSRTAQAQMITFKDQRIKLMNEALNGIKVLKLYAWEVPYQQKVDEMRKQEVKWLKRAAAYQSINACSWLLSPVLVTMCTFIMYVAISPDSTLTPSKAFVSLSLFNLLKQPMNTLPMMIASLVESHVSMERIRNYLAGEDLNELDTTTATEEYPIKVRNGLFTWDRSMPPLLKNINFEIPKGKLVAVIGQVGAGKSSLLSAILGEMEKESGISSIHGSIGYVPQQAWIQNVTLRDNILFGKALDWKRYNETLKACALEADIQLLPGGELTEIGEKGINLSGGQKQRVSLGRALYQKSDVYLLDDPLSAVDAHVGKHIFDHVIGPKGLLKDKTRVLVTHGIHWLPLVDSIVVMDKGKITESGTFQELMGHAGPFAHFIKTYLLEHADEDIDDPEVLKLKEKVLEGIETVLSDEELNFAKRSISIKSDTLLKSTESKKEKGENHDRKRNRLILDEKTETGKVKYTVYLHILRALGYGWFALILLMLCGYNTFNVTGGIWLSEWTSDSYLRNETNAGTDDYTSKTVLYLSVFSILSLCQVFGNATFILMLMYQMINASQRLHNSMLTNIMCQSMTFFDTTPLGRILNRFSRDVTVLDSMFNRNLRMVLQHLLSITSIVVVISYSAPIFMAFIIPIFIIYILLQRFYIPSSRQIRRLDSITRSPIFSQFAETLSGTSCIRAYKDCDRFMESSIDHIDLNNQCFFIASSASRWIKIRLEALGNFIVLFTAMYAVLSSDTSGSLVGLSLTYALQITQALNMVVQQANQLETNSVSAERILEYSNLPREPDWIVQGHRPSSHWPQYGQIEFLEYSTRYRIGLDLVLKSLTVKIKAGEMIGIVGRTGAGKSSLSMAIFRVIEAASGKILIDGLDISTIGLHDLRSQLTILPQDPVLFSGSLRFNLDPFDLYSDDEVWSALEHAHLGQFVRDFPGQLDFICEEGGQNLSVGQRQLVCLARSLLRKTKILVLDEATAAVDLETDRLLQQTIREAFKGCTVLTVAHRLNTVIDYDRIMVLSEGEVIEYDTPAMLLSNENSVFYGMAKESSLV